jgi:RecQ family ATP-dependent DNA helicase
VTTSITPPAALEPQALERALHDRFGLREFRPGQREAALALLEGRDLIAVMPTGAGKSLCFQLPALLLPGLTVVVSPLIALMKDQVDKLRARGIEAAALHSGLGPEERGGVERAMISGRLRLLYIAPERFGSAGFRELLQRVTPARLVVDEAHCISQWGHDFRPDYRRLAGVRAALGVPAAAFTATATPDVRADIATQLGLERPLDLITGFERTNLTLAVETCRSREEKATALARLVAAAGTPGIVYAATRKSVDLWADHLADLGFRTGRYHAGLSDQDRAEVQEQFVAGRLDVIVATNAFGMGVDKADLRFVIHVEIPGSVEAYYQEAGRAGRDGGPARCTLLFSPADVRTQEFFMAGANPTPELLDQTWRLLNDGLTDDEIADQLGRDAGASMSAATAARLLRRTAESLGVRPGTGPMPLDPAVRRHKARRDRERLDLMVRYAVSRGCRTRFVYDYFAGSARGGVAPRCGTCDVCLGWGRSAGRPLDDDELLRVRIALSGVGRLSGRFGVERIAQVLTGSRVREVLDRGLDRSPTYGKLAGMPADEVKDLLNVLADAGLIDRHGIEGGRPGAFVLALTPEGRRVAKGEDRPELALPTAAPRRARRTKATRRSSAPSGTKSADRSRAPRSGADSSESSLEASLEASLAPRSGSAPSAPSPRRSTDAASRQAKPEAEAITAPPDPALLERLKAWRREEARRKGVPSYVIFHDSTLEALAAIRPQSREALERVRGIGPAKLEAYGEALLGLLA